MDLPACSLTVRQAKRCWKHLMNYEIVSDNERVYFDTSMWVANILGDVPHNKGFEFAHDKFKELQNNAFHVYVSDLVLMECVEAIKKRVADHADGNPDTGMSTDCLQEEIEKKVVYFYQEIEKSQHKGMITVENPQGSV